MHTGWFQIHSLAIAIAAKEQIHVMLIVFAFVVLEVETRSW